MKKVYVKPDIVFESFTLCTSIATTCQCAANYAPNMCDYTLEYSDEEVYSVFTDKISACRDIKESDSEFNGLCYHNPNLSYNVFNS